MTTHGKKHGAVRRVELQQVRFCSVHIDDDVPDKSHKKNPHNIYFTRCFTIVCQAGLGEGRKTGPVFCSLIGQRD